MWRFLMLGWLLGLLHAAEPLPVYIEDSHAGSFGFFATTLSLDEPHVLLLFDEHSDASAVEHSDDVREGLRRVQSADQRRERIKRWRSDGVIQAFNWIEPLMPRPIDQVLWIRENDPQTVGKEAHEHLDPAQAQRASGQLASRFRVVHPDRWEKEIPDEMPVVATIDLDAFAGMPPESQERSLQEIWKRLTALPRLRALSFAISRPWLKDDEEAQRLLGFALDAACSVRNAIIHYEPFIADGPDRSKKAKESYVRGQAPPRFDVTTAAPALRAKLLTHRDRIRVDDERWNALLDRWQVELGTWRVVADGAQADVDGVLRAEISQLPVLRVVTSLGESPGQTRWWLHEADAASYNILPDLPAGKVFTGAAAPLIREHRSMLAETNDGALPPALWMTSLKQGFGRVRISAEVDGQSSPPLEVRVLLDRKFRGGLSEQFGMPYVFGAGFLRQGDESGPDTGVGNDCANFLVYSWRRSGVAMPWCNPAQLKRHLALVKEHLKPGDRWAVSREQIERGMVVHLGSHVAAVWEDLPPLRVLDSNDLVAHHLGGFPEIITLQKLLEKRSSFDLYELPQSEVAVNFVIGGDVNLARSPEAWKGDTALREADLAVVNLECSLAGRAVDKRYAFVANADAVSHLKRAGIDAVSLANNHAFDGGAEGFAQTQQILAREGIVALGTMDADGTCKPWLCEMKGARIAVFAATCVDEEGAKGNGIVRLPDHERELSQGIGRAKDAGYATVVFMHWGRENTTEISEDQRLWARWLVTRGVDAVIGAHPHVVQHHEIYRGRPVWYSLGNHWFPEMPSNGTLLKLSVDQSNMLTTERVTLPAQTTSAPR